MPSLPQIIAHRGESADYPENTVSALTAALDAGADGVEFDVQFTGDGHPVVLHDRDLGRTGGLARFIDDFDADDVSAGRLPAHEPERFGEDFQGETVPSLATAVAALTRHSSDDALVFVELKTETAAAVGASTAVRRVLTLCEPLGPRLVLIGFDAHILRTARSLGAPAVGWIVSPNSALDREQAQVMVPDYLFAERTGVPTAGSGLWRGRWQWIAYEVNTADEARTLAEFGVWGVETNSVRRLRSDQ